MPKARLILLAVSLALLLTAPGWAMKLLEQVEWRFIFFPTANIDFTPADLGAAYQDIYFPTADGETLNGWFVPAPRTESGDPTYTLLWFHGNGGNLGHRAADVVRVTRRLGVNVFIFDYRGYGRSSGNPTEAGVYQDARGALSHLAGRPGVESGRIVFLGRSLGTAVAVELADSLPAGQSPAGIILVSPLTNTKEVARLHNRFNPLRFLVPNRFNSLARISGIAAPLLIIHSDRDEMIPLEQGQRLYQAAAEPRTLHVWAGAGHNDEFDSNQEALWLALEDFLASLTP